ncbi:unnamed protein product, partial [Meganyctiphanes norvegica]
MPPDAAGSNKKSSWAGSNKKSSWYMPPGTNKKSSWAVTKSLLGICRRACGDLLQSSNKKSSCNKKEVTRSLLAGHVVTYFRATEQFTLLSILFIFIVVGNVAVIIALMLSKARKSRTNFFIMQLALADLSVGLITVLSDVIWKITVSWLAGNVMCKIVNFARELVTYSSTYVLVALSIDRYDAITHPMNFSGSWQRARRLVIVAWVLSAIFASPSLYLFSEVEYHCRTQCWLHMPEVIGWELYVWLVALTVFIIPTILITACYAIIVHTIWSKSMHMNVPSKHRAVTNGEKRGGSNHEDDSRRASSRGLIPKAKIKTVKMTLVIVFVYSLYFYEEWFPFDDFDDKQIFKYTISKTCISLTGPIFLAIQFIFKVNLARYFYFYSKKCQNLR